LWTDRSEAKGVRATLPERSAWSSLAGSIVSHDHFCAIVRGYSGRRGRIVICAKFIVSGRVQGVFFRASTRAEAERLGLCGHARNLADGSVEVIAHGDVDALRELEAWLQHGPPSAHVQTVVRTELTAETQMGSGFRTF